MGERMTTIAGRLRALSPLTRGLALFALANIVIVNALVLILPTKDRSEFALHTTVRFLLFRAGADSWLPMSQAWAYLGTGASASVYDYVYEDLGNKFQYPLTSLFPIEIVQAVLRGDVVRFGPLNLLSWLAVWGTALFVVLIFEQACREHLDARLFGAASSFDGVARAGVVVALSVTFYPLVRAFTIGQVQTWIDLAFAAMVWLWMKGRPVPAGFVAGLIFMVKPQLGLLLIWAALRRQWGFATALAGVAGSAFLAAVALYGIGQNRAFVSFMAFAGRRGESYWPNQSVNGILNRLLSNGPNATFRVDGAAVFPPYDPAVYAGTVISSLLLIGFALLWRRGEHDAAGAIDLMIAGLTFTMASPIAWEHHYGVLLPMYAALLPALLRWPVFGRGTLAWLGASYVLTSNVFYITVYAADTPFTPVQAYLFAGALVVLASLYLVRHAAAAESQRGEAGANVTPGAVAAGPAR